MISRQHLFTIFCIVLSHRFFLWIIAAIAPFFLPFEPSYPYYQILSEYNLPDWINRFAGFDGVHYLTITEHGYDLAGLVQAFFPVWPLLLQLSIPFTDIKFNPLILSQIYTLIALIGIGVAAKMLLNSVYPKISVWIFLALLFTFPAAFFFHSLYTESLFLLLTLATFLAAHHKKWRIAACIMAVASATRIVGIVLVPALLIELWWQNRTLSWQDFFKQHWQSILLILLGSSGLLAYMSYLAIVFGDPLLFRTVQSDWGHDRSSNFVLYPQVIVRYLKMFKQSFAWTLGWLSIAFEFCIGVLAPIAPLSIWKILRPSHIFFSIIVVLIPISTGTFSSLPRYVLVAFPFFITATYWLQSRRFLLVTWLILSTLLQICFTILFIQGYWVA